MDRRSILRLLLICAFAALIYLADIYLIVPPVERITVQGDGTGFLAHGDTSQTDKN